MTDDLRERVARLVCSWDGGRICSAMCGTCCNTADAAIALIRAEVLEEAARVADAEGGDWDDYPTFNTGWASAAEKIAAAIRALKDA